MLFSAHSFERYLLSCYYCPAFMEITSICMDLEGWDIREQSK